MRYKTKYRCQICGAEIYGDEVDAPDGKPRFQLHGCMDGSYGIGMLVGFEVVNGKEEAKPKRSKA